MISSIKITSFRGVKEGHVDGLSRISVLVGPNNSGKSTCLEAIYAVACDANVNATVENLLRRGGAPLDALERAFPTREAVFSAKEDTRERTLTLNLLLPGVATQASIEAQREGLPQPSQVVQVIGREWAETAVSSNGAHLRMPVWNGTPPLPSPPPFVDVEAVRAEGALEDAYSTLEKAGRLGSVVSALSHSMQDLRDLRILKVGENFVLHTFVGDRPPVPAYLAGDGLKRFLRLAAALYERDGDLVLLEEPESFQHPRYLRELVSLLVERAREGTQVILSTHSMDLLELLLHAQVPEGASYPTVHRLRLVDGVLRAVAVPLDRARSLQDELSEDLRA